MNEKWDEKKYFNQVVQLCLSQLPIEDPTIRHNNVDDVCQRCVLPVLQVKLYAEGFKLLLCLD